MANYKETVLTGSEYTRCKKILVSNPLNAVPHVEFEEERVTILSTKTLIEQTYTSIIVEFDPSKIIDVLNPITGESTGKTATWGDIYALVYSAYIAEATARDNG